MDSDLIRGLLEEIAEMATPNSTVIVQVNLDDIEQDLPAYLQRVEAGETLVILKEGKPIAELKPTAPVVKPQRPFGLCAGEFVVPDDFDAPLPEHILREFEGR